MKRKHFLATALTGIVAALLPKRGESVPMPKATEVQEPLPVATPEPKNVLCTYTTHDGYTVIPKYRGSCVNDPLAHWCTIGVTWECGGGNYGVWFHTDDEDMFFDAEVLLHAARTHRGNIGELYNPCLLYTSDAADE